MMSIFNISPDWLNSNEHICCSLAGNKCIVSAILDKNAIGIGSVEYCRSIYAWSACNPYPDWLNWGRKIYTTITKQAEPLFYKPADVPKRFESKIMNTPPSGKWIASEIVEFIKEWRAYVISGKVVAVYCYSDFDDETNIKFPWKLPNITAAIDFGLTSDGKILPVEVNDPYAIGWYGSVSDYRIYADFVKAGWKVMLERN